MMSERKSFVVYCEWEQHLSLLSAEDNKALWEAIFAYVKMGDFPELPPAAQMAFSFMKAQLDRDGEKYSEKRAVLEENIRKRRERLSKEKATRNRNEIETKSERNRDEIETKSERNRDEIESVNVNDNVNVLFKNEKNTPPKSPSEGDSAEPEKPDSPPKPSVITLTLNTGAEWPVTEQQVREWQELFPGVDVMQQLRNMRAWCSANPEKRKTEKGVKRFVTAWLTREQDKGGKRQTASPLSKRREGYDEEYARQFQETWKDWESL